MLNTIYVYTLIARLAPICGIRIIPQNQWHLICASRLMTYEYRSNNHIPLIVYTYYITYSEWLYPTGISHGLQIMEHP